MSKTHIEGNVKCFVCMKGYGTISDFENDHVGNDDHESELYHYLIAREWLKGGHGDGIKTWISESLKLREILHEKNAY